MTVIPVGPSTVSMAFVREAVACLPDDEAVRSRILSQAGIAPRQMADADARLSPRQFATAWLGIIHELQDEFFGLDARGMPPGSFALICRSLSSSRTVGHAMHRCLQSFGLFLTVLRGRLEVDGQVAKLVIVRGPGVASADRFAHEILATVFHGVLCWLVGQPVRLSSAEFAYPRPAHGDEYQTMFCRALRFDAERTTLHFDARWLSQPLRLDDDRCRRFLATAPLSIFVRHRNPDSWTVRVRKHLRGLSPADWPTIDKAARQLGIAPSTFVRCLAAEGVSYQRVKDDLRRDRALHLLRSTGHGMAEIASELGFEEASAFHRAFKR